MEVGRGVSSESAKYQGNPFASRGEEIKSETTGSDKILRKVIKSAFDQSDSLDVSATISGEGWGATAKADMAYNSVSSLSFNEVKFIISR